MIGTTSSSSYLKYWPRKDVRDTLSKMAYITYTCIEVQKKDVQCVNIDFIWIYFTGTNKSFHVGYYEMQLIQSEVLREGRYMGKKYFDTSEYYGIILILGI